MVTTNGNDLEVVFNDTKHKYTINQDGIIEQYNELGNYLVDNANYYDTLAEAIAAASDGSIIKVTNNVTETSSITIDKSITIDLNGKCIDYVDNNRIAINADKDVKIEGNGELIGESNNLSLILNYGNLELNGVTINSPVGGAVFSTIYNLENATVISNNSNISNITGDRATKIIINGGEYGNISGAGGGQGTVVINGGTINYLDLLRGGISTSINSGKIGTISVGDNSGNINLTIGNVDESVNNNNPQIGNIELNSPDLAVLTAIFNFYNGIIKDCDDLIEYALLDGGNLGVGTYNIRPGYKTQKTSEGIILVKE